MLADTWVSAEVPEARADLLHAIHERITVVGRSIVSARLAHDEYLALVASAEARNQVGLARPEGFEPPTI